MRARISVARHHPRRRPARGAADVHVFDEADLGAEAAGVGDEVDQLVVVLAADHHRVDLDRAERRDRGGDALEHGRQIARPRQAFEAIDLQRVEAHGDPIEPGIAQGRGRRGEMDAVGRQRSLAQAVARRQPRDEARQIAAQQRLAAGQPHPGHPFADEDAGQAIDLLEAQEIRARQPHVLRLGHAIEAAQVAAIGDRHAQCAQWAVERVEHGHLSDYGIRRRHRPRRRQRRRSPDRPVSCAGARNVISVHQAGDLGTEMSHSRRMARVTPPGWGDFGPCWPSALEMSVYLNFCKNRTGM